MKQTSLQQVDVSNKIGVPQNGWFVMENAVKMDDWGVPYFWKHPSLTFPFLDS